MNIIADMKRPSDPDVILLAAAADPTRLAILRQLSAEEAVCACDFTSCCNVAQPTISHHLKVLRDAGWVKAERRGTWIWYSIRPEAVARFAAIGGGITAGAAMPAAMLNGRRDQTVAAAEALARRPSAGSGSPSN